MSSRVEEAIFDLLHAPHAPRSVSPEEVARRAAGEAWRRVLPEVRAVAVALAGQGRLHVLRHGRPVDPEGFKGVYRLGLPDAGA